MASGSQITTQAGLLGELVKSTFPQLGPELSYLRIAEDLTKYMQCRVVRSDSRLRGDGCGGQKPNAQFTTHLKVDINSLLTVKKEEYMRGISLNVYSPNVFQG